MKKLLVIMIVAMVTAIAAQAFAVTPISNPTGTTIGGAVFVPSANVTIQVGSDATNYAATSAHISSASGPGYQFQIWNSFNGITKKAWAAGETSTTNWPTPVTSSTGTIAGFQ